MTDHQSAIEEILSGPGGPQIGALFDFDGTIIEGYSATSLFQDKLKKRDFSLKELAETVSVTARFSRGNADFSELMATTSKTLEGVTEASYDEYGEELYEKYIARKVYPEARELIKAHQSKGHTVAIISSATIYQIAPTARDLEVEHVHCSAFEVKKGKFTGDIVLPLCFGEGKVLAAKKLVKSEGVKLSKSYFYSDSDDDLELLESVGKPRVVNPNKKLKAIAKERGWSQRNFNNRKATATDYVRSYYTNMSLLGTMVASMPIRALTGSDREAANFTIGLYGDIASAIAGMKVEITGEEHAWSHRPAIFVFNHQSAADPIIVAKVVRKDAGAVGKKELGKIPVIGRMMKNMGTVFIDRKNAESAIAAMEPLIDAVKIDKQSIIIAPEGTRSLSPKLGAFKKGAFHLALQTGAPMVPVVIHNAIDVQPKGRVVLKPATVKVEVLPPVDTSGWTHETLGDHVREVRSMFLRTLGQPEDSGAAKKPTKKNKRKAKATAKAGGAQAKKKTSAKKSRAKAAATKSPTTRKKTAK